MYKFYRMLPNGVWKYTETINSTLSPDYHQLINYCKENNVKWKLVNSYNEIKFQG